MLRLAALAIVLGGLAAAFCLVPLRGRTALARFEAAPDAGTFFSSAWDEWRGPHAPAAKHTRPPAAKRDRSEKTARRPEHAPEPAADAPLARADAAPRGRPAPPAPSASQATRPPAEDHRESDRAALDRLLSERSR
jgi:hypothetical protein